MKKTSFAVLLMAVFATATLVSCKKDKTEDDYSAENNMTENIALSESSYTDVGNIVDEAATTDELTSFKSGCATVVHDSTSTPRKITIDFGTTNCTCKDGKNRRGKILVTYTGRYRDNGTVITTTFDNFFVNDNQVTGTRTVTNNGKNTNGEPVFSIDVNGSVILASGKGTVTYTSSRTRVWVAGSGTRPTADDVYLITGSASMTGPNGDSFTASIRSALRVELSCSNIVSGVIDFSKSRRGNCSIDFGTGTCDNQAMLTLGNGKTRAITLR